MLKPEHADFSFKLFFAPMGLAEIQPQKHLFDWATSLWLQILPNFRLKEY